MGRSRRYGEDQPERIKLLSLVDVLEPLTSEEIDWISRSTPNRSFEKNEIVYSPGEASEVLFLLLKGRIRVYGTAALAGQEFTFDVIQAGTIFGLASLAGRAHPEYAQALEPSLIGLLHLNTW